MWNHNPLSETTGAPQLAKTRISTMVKKWNEVCHIGRFSGGGIMFICSSFLAFSSLWKIIDIRSPMITENTMAPTMRAIPISTPNIRAVKMIDKILIAGPEYRKAMAGPSPAPRLYMLVNNGRIVQEQTARIPPEMAAIV